VSILLSRKIYSKRKKQATSNRLMDETIAGTCVMDGTGFGKTTQLVANDH
jgi:hypothetical protein